MLKNLQYEFFNARELKPTGWLKRQLRVQADGLAGNLDKVWPDVRDSGWIGGPCESWERVPYWLDGFIPLAYLLEDEDMIARANRYMETIIERQAPDGWLCPCSQEERGSYDTWSVMLILKVLTVYADCTGDERIPDVLERALKNFSKHINFNTLRTWGAARWYEGLISIFWLYERRPAEWLLTLAKKLRVQGFNWREILDMGVFDSFERGEWNLYYHGVNIAMALKSEALLSRIDDVDPERLADEMQAYLDENHSMAVGLFTADECLAGTDPIHGIEFCTVVESMFSYEHLFSVTGSPKWLDRLEKAAYNALPAITTPDMWARQYDEMTNQVASFPMSKPAFLTNSREAHLFGLETHFGCCTANFGQGWPKFVFSTFMKSKDGIASCSLAPSIVKTEINGVPVTCELITEYPFRDSLKYRVTAERPVEFSLSIRIPSWAVDAKVDGQSVPAGAFHTVRKTWSGQEEVAVSMTFETAVTSRPKDMACVWRGPLLYSIPIVEQWERVEYKANGVERKFPYCDYYIYPMSKWNYALASDRFDVTENDYDAPFATDKPPISLTATVAEIPWGFHNGYCDAQPESREPIAPPVEIRMIPYGCTNLRMTEVPFIG